MTQANPINRTNIIIQSQQGIEAGSLIGVESAQNDPLLNGENVAQLLPEGEFNVLINWQLAQKLNLNVEKNPHYDYGE